METHSRLDSNGKYFILPLLLMCAIGYDAVANHDIYKSSSGEMLFGYDVVAYFTLGRAVKGSPDISVDWLGGKWLFKNDKHREMFVADPAQYVPQYGGYCSASYANGNRHGSADPRSWQIVDGKLYLFYSDRVARGWDIDFSSTEAANRQWEKARAGLLQE